MNTDKPSGGPAFPRPIGNNGATHYEDREVSCEEVGMSLRDYFAAQAVAAFIMHPIQVKTAALVSGQPSQNALASMAYEIADAMIAEREK